MFDRNPRVTGIMRTVLAMALSSILAGAAAAQDLEGQAPQDWKLLVACENGDPDSSPDDAGSWRIHRLP